MRARVLDPQQARENEHRYIIRLRDFYRECCDARTKRESDNETHERALGLDVDVDIGELRAVPVTYTEELEMEIDRKLEECKGMTIAEMQNVSLNVPPMPQVYRRPRGRPRACDALDAESEASDEEDGSADEVQPSAPLHRKRQRSSSGSTSNATQTTRSEDERDDSSQDEESGDESNRADQGDANTLEEHGDLFAFHLGHTKQETQTMFPPHHSVITDFMLTGGEDIPFVSVEKNELIVKFSIYHAKTRKLMQSLYVLGSQYLTEVRDALYCLSDYVLGGESRQSSMMYIEDTYYVDRRNPDNIDYSAEYRQYRERRGHATEAVKNMEASRVIDLNVVPGKRYLFLHQGMCAHGIAVTEIRMMTPLDEQNRNMYPLLVYQAVIRHKRCQGCGERASRVVVLDAPHLERSPQLVCQSCFDLFTKNRSHPSARDFVHFDYLHD